MSKILAGISLLVIGLGVAGADHCKQFFQVQPQAVIVQPQMYYSAGEDLRLQAIVKQLVRKEIQALAKQEQNVPQEVNEGKYHNLRLHCAKCHSASTPGGPKKGLILDGTVKVNGIAGIKALRALRDETMPPNTKLPEDSFPALMNDILNLEYNE